MVSRGRSRKEGGGLKGKEGQFGRSGFTRWVVKVNPGFAGFSSLPFSRGWVDLPHPTWETDRPTGGVARRAAELRALPTARGVVPGSSVF